MDPEHGILQGHMRPGTATEATDRLFFFKDFAPSLIERLVFSVFPSQLFRTRM